MPVGRSGAYEIGGKRADGRGAAQQHGARILSGHHHGRRRADDPRRQDRLLPACADGRGGQLSPATRKPKPAANPAAHRNRRHSRQRAGRRMHRLPDQYRTSIDVRPRTRRADLRGDGRRDARHRVAMDLQPQRRGRQRPALGPRGRNFRRRPLSGIRNGRSIGPGLSGPGLFRTGARALLRETLRGRQPARQRNQRFAHGPLGAHDTGNILPPVQSGHRRRSLLDDDGTQ